MPGPLTLKKHLLCFFSNDILHPFYLNTSNSCYKLWKHGNVLCTEFFSPGISPMTRPECVVWKEGVCCLNFPSCFEQKVDHCYFGCQACIFPGWQGPWDFHLSTSHRFYDTTRLKTNLRLIKSIEQMHLIKNLAIALPSRQHTYVHTQQFCSLSWPANSAGSLILLCVQRRLGSSNCTHTIELQEVI